MTATEPTAPTADGGLHAIALVASNIKRIQAIDVALDPHMQVISGRNAQGKSSAIDTLAYGLGGPKLMKDCSEVIRRGERRASVEITLGTADGTPRVVVAREWKANGSQTLTVTDPTGAKYTKPQTVLDDLIGHLAFDPLPFMAAKGTDQRAQLLDLVELPFDPAELDASRKAAFDARTDENREVKRLAAVLEGLPEAPADTPDAEVSTVELVAEHQAATAAHTRAVESVRRIDEIDERIEALRAEAKQLAEERKGHVAAVEAANPLPDVAAIELRMANVDAINAEVRAKAARTATSSQLAAATGRVDELTAAIDAIDKTKTDGLAAATMPIDGLGFDSDGVTFNGLPLTQASGAEQLRVSLAIAIAANPTLRMMLIRDGALLDADSLAMVQRMAVDNGVQVLVERVAGSGGPVGIVIEDGLVIDGGREEVVEPTTAAVALIEGEAAGELARRAGITPAEAATAITQVPEAAPDLSWLDDDGPEAA